MNHRHLSIFIASLFLAACAHTPLQINSGPQRDIEIVQGQNAVTIDAEGTLHLQGKPFEIRSRWARVNVCISRSEADLGKISAGVDTFREMGSCFNLGKSYAMEADASYLVVGDGVNALNDAHGMRHGDKYYWFPVRFLYDDKSSREIELSKVSGRYFAAFWVDKNGDRRLDAGEFVLSPLLFGQNDGNVR